MSFTAAKRTYDVASLEPWVQRMTQPWEAYFTRSDLSLGKDIFRNKEVRELEVNKNEIIVHAKFDHELCYCLVEWRDNKPVVRGSTHERYLINALAVAGLMEVDELVRGTFRPKEEKPAEKKSALSSILAARKGKETPPKVKPLKLLFSVMNHALILEAFWQLEDNSWAPAYNPECKQEATAEEREKLIGLTNSARKKEFKLNQQTGRFSLKCPEQIQVFFKEHYPRWKERYNIELEPGLEKVQTGVQGVELAFDLTSQEDHTMEFSWTLQHEDNSLDEEHAYSLLSNPEKPLLFSDTGFLKLSRGQYDTLLLWRRWMYLFSDSPIPRYLLFSLFNKVPAKLVLEPKLTKWRDSLFCSPSTKPKAPDFLRSYQVHGVQWLWHICEHGCHGLLADDMGLGKTLQVLSFIHSRKLETKRPHLIVCPASVVPVWQKEIARFFPEMRVGVLCSTHNFTNTESPDIWVASYAQLRIHKDQLTDTEFGYAILDEAQTIKNPDAKASKACLCIKAKHRIALTGTPFENRYLDLWTLFRYLMPGLLGTRKSFEDQLNQDEAQFVETIRHQITPFFLRRTKSEVLKELPCKTEVELSCPLTDTQRQQYDRITQQGIQDLGEDLPEALKEKSISFLTLLTRLRQTCCDPNLLPWVESDELASGKINLLLDKLDEILAAQHKVVIFSQFVSLLSIIKKRLEQSFPDTPVYQLTGKTIDRSKPVQDFQEEDKPSIILVSLRAGGTGITLHSADYVFLMDPWWNPAVEEQAIDRVHRFGQENPVFVYRMITEGTIESRIQQLKSEKKEVFEGIFGPKGDLGQIHQAFNSLSDLIIRNQD